jgi:hypothetical protein
VGLGFPTRLAGEVAQALNSGDEAGVPGGDGGVDEVQLVTVMSNAWSASSMASRYGVEVRLERSRAAGYFGLMKRSSIYCEINQTKDVRGAPGLEEENRLGGERLCSPSTSESSGCARRYCGLRR